MYKQFFLFFMLLVISASGISQNPVPKKDWKLSLQMWTFNPFTFLEALDKADSCGLKIIEGFPGQKLGGNFNGKIGPSMSKTDRKKLKDLLQKRGFTMPAFGVVTGFEKADAEKMWTSFFDFAHDMGISILTAEPELDQLDMVNKLAGKYHIRVAIHNHPNPDTYANPEAVLAAIKNRLNIGACADVGHWARNGLNVAECLQKLKGHIFSVHLKDIKEFNVIDAPDVILGSGICNLPAVFSELKRQGFSGIISIEHEVENGYASLADVRSDAKYFYTQTNKLK